MSAWSIAMIKRLKRCPECKYPVGGLILDDIKHITCPECGHYYNPYENNANDSKSTNPIVWVVISVILILTVLLLTAALGIFALMVQAMNF